MQVDYYEHFKLVQNATFASAGYNYTGMWVVPDASSTKAYHVVRCYSPNTATGRDYYIDYDQWARSSPTPVSGTKSSYITDVVAIHGTYPADGMHTDGYYYVLKN